MKTNIHTLPFVFLALVFFIPAFSLPANAAGQGNLREACKDDAQTFCKGIQPGGGRIMNCLEDHYKEISDACYMALKNAPSLPGGHSNNASSEGSSHGGPPPDDNNGPPPDDKQ